MPKYSPDAHAEDFDPYSMNAVFARILKTLESESELRCRDRAESQEFRASMIEKVCNVEDEIKTVRRDTEEVKIQTTKTNGRVLGLESKSIEIENSIRDDCLKWSSILDIKKNWRAWLTIAFVCSGSGIATKFLSFLFDLATKYATLR